MKSAKIESLEALRVALFVAVFLFHAGGAMVFYRRRWSADISCTQCFSYDW